MKSLWIEKWETQAVSENKKTSKRLILNPQPTMDEHGMWHWMGDCQWMEGGLGIPRSGVEDHFPFHAGDALEILSLANGLPVSGNFRITSVWVEQLQGITVESAEKEGCRGVFSGTGESCGSGWEITPQDEFKERWNAVHGGVYLYGWDKNPWVGVIEFERIDGDQSGDSEGCDYCRGKTRMSFRCDVRTLNENNMTEDVPVPVHYCPYCGRILSLPRD